MNKEETKEVNAVIDILENDWQDFIELGMTPQLRDRLIKDMNNKLKNK